MKLLVFLHGTAIMHASAPGVGRDERVLQVRNRDPSVLDFAAYVPAEEVVSTPRRWHAQGSDPAYSTS